MISAARHRLSGRRARAEVLAAGLIALLAVATAQDPTPAPVMPVAAPAPAVVAPPGERILLRLAAQPGTVRVVRQLNDQDVELGPEDKPVRLRYTNGFDVRWEVLTPDAEGRPRVRWTIDAARYHQATPEGTLTYDSSAASPEPVPTPALLHAAIVGQAFEGTLTERGEVFALSGVDAVRAHLDSALEGAAPADLAMLRGVRDGLFAEASLREMVLLSLPIMPADALATGDTWGRQQRLDMGTPIDSNTTYTLVDRRDGKALVESMAMIATAHDAEPRDLPEGGRLSLVLDGDQRGRLEIDEATGFLLKARYEQALRGYSRVETAGTEGVPASGVVDTPVRLRTSTSVDTLVR